MMWIIIFYISLLSILLLILRRSLYMQKSVKVLQHHNHNVHHWFEPKLSDESLKKFSLRSVARIISFVLFIIVTILDELLHRIIHGLRKITTGLLKLIDTYERKHHGKGYTQSRAKMDKLKNEFPHHLQE